MEQEGLFSIKLTRKYYVMYVRNNAGFSGLGFNIQNLIKFYNVEYLRMKMDNINVIEEDQVMPYPIEWRSSFRHNYIDNIIEKGYWIQEFGYENLDKEPTLHDNLKYIYILDLDQERFKIKTEFMELDINIDEIGNLFKLKKN